MNKNIYCFFFCYLIIQVLSVVPEWDLSKAGHDILGLDTEKTIEINHRYLYNVEMIMKKKLTKTEEGIKVTNLLKIAGEEKEVKFEQVESYYNLFNKYIVCPKGSYHPYDFTNKEEIKPDEKFIGENWDLRCYKHSSGFFLVFYLMNGNNNMNMYLTNMKEPNWYGGASIEQDNYKETYDFLLKNKNALDSYQTLAILNEGNSINLVYLAYTLKEGTGNQHANSHLRKEIIAKHNHAQAYFKNSTDDNKYFYYFTYNDINDFKTGYSTSSINVDDDYYNLILEDKIKIKNNDNPHFEFFDNMEIEKMEFLLYNKFIYYEMKSLNNSDKYYGIFDVKLNKIIFNTKEEITKFIPYNDMAMLAITKEKAYKVCVYNSNNDCIDTCENNNYLLDIEGNKCGQGCSDGKLTFVPLEVCINECDTKYYVVNDDKCGLCKDMNTTHPYKLIGGTECLEEQIKGSYIYNENLKLLNCSEGFHLDNNKCERDIPCYELCLDCYDGSINETDQKCTSCIDGFKLDENNNCICPSGKEKKDKQCLNCSNECGTFKINKCDCESCIEHFFLKDSQCKECDSSCLNCEAESTNCTECYEKTFFENNKCYNCTDCKEKESDSCKCISCNESYYMENHQCLKCGNECKECSSATKCLTCNESYYLENGECKQCSEIPFCISREINSCKCSACKQNYFLHGNECHECNNETKCNTYEDSEKCKCKTCNKGYYIDNNNFYCEKCDENCETCDGGSIDAMNNHCLSCKKDSEDKYLINKDNKHFCVSDCSKYNGTNNEEKYICEFKESQETPEKQESRVDYALIIVVCVIGVILIIISACICKKFICQKNEVESIEEIEEGELIDK